MIKKVFYLLFFALIVYSGIQYAIPFYHYYAFKSDLEETVEVSVETTPNEIMEKVMSLVAQYKIPVEMKDISLSRNGRYVVKISWEETVNLFDIYKKTFRFYIDTSTGSGVTIVGEVTTGGEVIADVYRVN